jgi:hypothetical protein
MRKPLTYSSVFAAAAFLAFIMASGAFTPASAAMPIPNLKTYTVSEATPVHCRRYRHCHRRCWGPWWDRRCGRRCHRC